MQCNETFHGLNHIKCVGKCVGIRIDGGTECNIGCFRVGFEERNVLRLDICRAGLTKVIG